MANSTETVTVRLIVAADGALQTLDKFDREMVGAANASVKAGSAVEAFNQQIARQRAAIEAGIPVLKASTQVRSQEERILQTVLGKADAYARARINAERDIARAVASASNLVIQGKMAEEDAIRQVTAVERAHVASINRVIEAERRSAEAAQNTAVSVRSSADAIQAYNMSASRNAAESANIAMQFQDIAVSAQMGMNPMMIAMQQGTQLSAIFNQMKNPLQALPAAFFSIINPVSLLTIGLVGLTSAAIQWWLSSSEGDDKAATALERHAEMLDKLLVGYGDLRDRASEAVEQALRLPEGVVASDLLTDLQAQEQALQGIADRAADLNAQFTAALPIARAQKMAQDIIDQITQLANLEISVSSTAAELDKAATAARTLYNTAVDAGIKQWAADFYALTVEQREVNALLRTTDELIRKLPREVQITMRMNQEFGSAIGGMQDLYMDPRDRFTIAREQLQNNFDHAMATATSYGQLVGAATEYERVLNSINAAEAEAAAKAEARGKKETPADKWKDDVAAFEQRIAAQRLEIELFGQSTFEIERQKAAFELLNQAKAAGVAITPQLEQQIQNMASAYAQATAELERMQFQQQQIDQINGALQQGFADVFTSILDGSKSAEQAIGDLLGSLGKLLINQAFQTLFAPAGVGGLGFGIGGGGGGLFGGSIIPGILHDGGVAGQHGYNHGRSFDASVWVGAPRYHNGGTVGLKPDEVPAILQRGETVLPRGAGGGNTTFSMQATIHANSEQEGAAAARGWQAEMKRWQQSGAGHAFVRSVINKPGRANGTG